METVLEMFKIDLGITHTLRDTFFNNFLSAQQKELESKGISLDLTNTEDIMLLSDYAAWNYKKRNEDIGLSKNLTLRIRNRIVKERAKDAETDTSEG